MAKQKKTRVKRKSGLTGASEGAEPKATEDWLRTVDRPLGIKEGDKRRERKKRRRAKKRGK